MEQPSGGGQDQLAWKAGFQRRYLGHLLAIMRCARIEPATSVSTRSRTVKFAADLSLAMTSRGRTAWSRAIIGKHHFWLRKSRCVLRGVKSRGNFGSVSRSAFARSRPCKKTGVCKKLARQLLRTVSKTGHNCKEEAGDTVFSRLQTLRMLVPGSQDLDTPSFLKDAADYIVSLKMQVQAMQALADWYSNSTAHFPRQV